MRQGQEIKVTGGVHAGKVGEILSSGLPGGIIESKWVRFASGEADWVAMKFLEVADQEGDTFEAAVAMAGAALETQVGGDHYKNLPIQPVIFCQRNKLGYCESAVVKYVCRHRSKNGRKDLEKAIHYLQILIEEEYPE